MVLKHSPAAIASTQLGYKAEDWVSILNHE